ncbi:uncharacterized protein A1O9_08725 [Exophiala aquamarina CBS 119918]|uniref:SH3 domain-containing protein n=1 Tax=Exophiala aquamarina CBS 119918 TaxID=1182545 RepID=A0A072P5S4_9EURO|nr:uncharacterized protein A1O9_08725 [Exophiala aquamarina CBS 119918]KEF55072.1 hypothetical protein A1O9_08725 [Exophiala aquamarina CBS 119918]
MDHSHQHFHNQMANLAKRQDVSTDGGTVYSVVYVTAEPTFTGVIGGFTTLTDETAAPTDTQTSVPIDFTTAPTETVVGPATTSTPEPTLSSPTNFSNANTSVDTSVAPAAATGGSSANSAASSSSSSEGMSTAAKAGIAIGVIGVVGVVAIILLWLLGKKKKQRQALDNKDNEKSGYGTGAAAGTPPTEMLNRSPTNATAPRLSLRPVSRMLPEFMAPAKGRLSSGNMLNTIGEGPAQKRNLSPSPQPRDPSPSHQRPRENPFADPQNPFADPEKPVQAPTPLSLSSAVTKPAPLLPMAATIVPAATAISSPAAVTASPQMAQVETPTPLRSQAPAPAPEPIAMQSAVPASIPSTPVTPGPVIATGPGPESAQGNVYRVMMDFKPSMEDELELVVGQLVRMLHEYDDGWALCIKLDRSQQGVVPRTCLAAKPSKPKPAHLNQYARGNGANSPQPNRPIQGPGSPMSRPMSPANGGPRSGMPPSRPMSPAGRPGQRPMSPAGRPGQRPMSPAGRPGQRSMSPAGMNSPRAMSPGPYNQAPRPLSPGPRQSNRSMSPGPYGGRGGPPPMGGTNSRRRSNSASAANVRDRRNTPPGPSNLRQGTSSQGPGIAL